MPGCQQYQFPASRHYAPLHLTLQFLLNSLYHPYHQPKRFGLGCYLIDGSCDIEIEVLGIVEE